jgi:hypothetical protein
LRQNLEHHVFAAVLREASAGRSFVIAMVEAFARFRHRRPIGVFSSVDAPSAALNPNIRRPTTRNLK